MVACSGTRIITSMRIRVPIAHIRGTTKSRGSSYGGGPSCEHNYTTGLLHYHFLTGSPEARESVLSLADWVIRMDDGRNTVFGLLDNGPTGAASATVSEDFHGPGRGAGNSINALLDGWILTGSELLSEQTGRAHPSLCASVAESSMTCICSMQKDTGRTPCF